jgi:RHS repeat-associated protein
LKRLIVLLGIVVLVGMVLPSFLFCDECETFVEGQDVYGFFLRVSSEVAIPAPMQLPEVAEYLYNHAGGVYRRYTVGHNQYYDGPNKLWAECPDECPPYFWNSSGPKLLIWKGECSLWGCEYICFRFIDRGAYDPYTYDFDCDGDPDVIDEKADTPPAQLTFGGQEHNPNTAIKNERSTTQGCDKANEQPDGGTGMPALLINLAHLNFFLQDKDIAYLDFGRTIQVLRHYNAYSTYEGIFGRGWTFNYGTHLQEDPSGDVVITWGSGAKKRFALKEDGTYTPPKAVYDQLSKNPDGTFTLWVKRSRLTYAFDSNGVLTAVTDTNGNTATLSYDSNNLLTTITDASGRTISLSYNADNKVETITDPLNRPITFTYENGDMKTSSDLAGVTTTFTYDAEHYLTAMTTPNGTTSFTYQDYPFGRRLASATDAEGNTTQYTIDAPNQEVLVTDARDNTTRYGYNYYGYTTCIIDPLGNKTEFGYDAKGNRTSITDANGKTTTISYDARGNITGVTDPLGNSSAFAYDERDNLTGATDPLGHSYHYDYDANDNLVKITDPFDHQTDFAYDAHGQLLSLTDARGNTSAFAYDQYGNLEAITDPLENKATFTYNLIGKRESATDPLGNISHFAYDPLGRLIKRIHPDGAEYIIHRYCSGISGITDENTIHTDYEHDNINQRTRIINALGHETSFAYDGTGNLTALTDPLGQTTAFTYDVANRLAQTSYPEGTTEAYTYDPVGNFVTTIDANGQEIANTYDDLNRLISVTGPDLSITYSYDGVGNLIAMTDATGTTNYGYDDLNRLAQVTYPNGLIVGYSYNEVGLITTITTPFGTVGYTYDVANRLSSITLPNTQQVSYYYDAAGNLTEVAYPNGTAAAYAYDNRNRLLTLSNTAPGETVIASYEYTLDGVGNRTGVDLFEPLIPSFPTETIAYTYTSGNILASGDGTTYTHDANGNRIQKTTGAATTTYTYDPLDRLTGVTTGTQNYQYLYNGLGQRVGKIVDGVQTNYLIDPNGLLHQVLAEMDEDNNLIAFYVYGGAGLVAKITPGDEYYFYHYDGLGSTVAITDENAQIVNAYAYSPYGLVGAQETIQNPFTYVGRFGVMAEGNGLYYMRARYYDPQVGRFINKDPIGYAGGMNLYEYVRNNSVNWVDFFGLKPIISIKYSEGLQFGARIGIFAFNTNFGSQNYNLVTGEYTVEQSFRLGLSTGKNVFFGVGVEREACGLSRPSQRDMLGRVIPGTGLSISQILFGTPWEWSGFPGSGNFAFGQDFSELTFGAALILGIELKIDIDELCDRITKHVWENLRDY